jgi:hypothetical protein
MEKSKYANPVPVWRRHTEAAIAPVRNTRIGLGLSDFPSTLEFSIGFGAFVFFGVSAVMVLLFHVLVIDS